MEVGIAEPKTVEGIPAPGGNTLVVAGEPLDGGAGKSETWTWTGSFGRGEGGGGTKVRTTFGGCATGVGVSGA